MAQIKKYSKGDELARLASLDSEVQAAYQAADDNTKAAMNALAGTYRNYVATGEIGSRDTRRLQIDLNKRLLAVANGEQAYDPFSIKTASYNMFGYLSSRDRDSNGIADEVEVLGNQLAALTFAKSRQFTTSDPVSYTYSGAGYSAYTPQSSFTQILGDPISAPTTTGTKTIEINSKKYLSKPHEEGNINPKNFARGLYKALQDYSSYGSLPEYRVVGDLSDRVNPSDLPDVLSSLQDIINGNLPDDEAKQIIDSIISSYGLDASESYGQWFPKASPTPTQPEEASSDNTSATSTESAETTTESETESTAEQPVQEPAEEGTTQTLLSQKKNEEKDSRKYLENYESLAERADDATIKNTASGLHSDFEILDIYNQALKGTLGKELANDNSSKYAKQNQLVGDNLQGFLFQELENGQKPRTLVSALLNFMKNYPPVVNQGFTTIQRGEHDKTDIGWPIIEFCLEYQESLEALLLDSSIFSPTEKEIILNNFKEIKKLVSPEERFISAKNGAKLVYFLTEEDIKMYQEGGQVKDQDIIDTAAGKMDVSGATAGLSEEAKQYIRASLQKEVSTAANLGVESGGLLEDIATNSAVRNRAIATAADLISAIASFCPGAGTAVAAGAGITATILNAVADHESGLSVGEIATGIAKGVAGSAVTILLPGLAGVKIGPKIAALMRLVGPSLLAYSGSKQGYDKFKDWADPNHKWTKQDAAEAIQALGSLLGSLSGFRQVYKAGRASANTAATKKVEVEVTNGSSTKTKTIDLYTSERQQIADAMKGKSVKDGQAAAEAKLKEILKNRNSKVSNDLAKQNLKLKTQIVEDTESGLSKRHINRRIKRWASTKGAEVSALDDRFRSKNYYRRDQAELTEPTMSNLQHRNRYGEGYYRYINGLDENGVRRSGFFNRIFNGGMQDVHDWWRDLDLHLHWPSWLKIHNPFPYISRGLGNLGGGYMQNAKIGGRLQRLQNYVNNH